MRRTARELRLLRRALNPFCARPRLVRGRRGVPGRRLGLPVRGVEFAFFSLEFRPERAGGLFARGSASAADPRLCSSICWYASGPAASAAAAVGGGSGGAGAAFEALEAPPSVASFIFCVASASSSPRAFARGGAFALERVRQALALRLVRGRLLLRGVSFALEDFREPLHLGAQAFDLLAASAPLARCFFLYASTSRLARRWPPGDSSTAFLCSARRRASSACASIADWRSRLSLSISFARSSAAAAYRRFVSSASRLARSTASRRAARLLELRRPLRLRLRPARLLPLPQRLRVRLGCSIFSRWRLIWRSARSFSASASSAAFTKVAPVEVSDPSRLGVGNLRQRVSLSCSALAFLSSASSLGTTAGGRGRRLLRGRRASSSCFFAVAARTGPRSAAPAPRAPSSARLRRRRGLPALAPLRRATRRGAPRRRDPRSPEPAPAPGRLLRPMLRRSSRGARPPTTASALAASPPLASRRAPRRCSSRRAGSGRSATARSPPRARAFARARSRLVLHAPRPALADSAAARGRPTRRSPRPTPAAAARARRRAPRDVQLARCLSSPSAPRPHRLELRPGDAVGGVRVEGAAAAGAAGGVVHGAPFSASALSTAPGAAGRASLAGHLLEGGLALLRGVLDVAGAMVRARTKLVGEACSGSGHGRVSPRRRAIWKSPGRRSRAGRGGGAGVEASRPSAPGGGARSSTDLGCDDGVDRDRVRRRRAA